jgi:ubiquinone/menaquinone biosynthesis C-methylase UbiE
VICWFTSFGYFDDDDNRNVLSEFARVLGPGGRLLIETIHHDGSSGVSRVRTSRRSEATT